jgi:murein L,D-transpeptidase YcbB/YkuD
VTKSFLQRAGRCFLSAYLVFLTGLSAVCRAEETGGAIPSVPPLEGAAASIQAILREGIHPRLQWGRFPDYQPSLEAVYQPRNYQPIWIIDGRITLPGRAAVRSISEADSKGLNASDYNAELLVRWQQILDQISDNQEEVALLDTAISLSLMRYINSLYLGRINPRNVNFGLNIEPKRLDLAKLIDELSRDEQLGQRVDALEPRLALYENLKKALVRYRELEKDQELKAIALPAKLRPGERHEGLAALRRLLTALGDLPPAEEESPAESKIYIGDLVDGVKHFQERHGLVPDGVIGKSTQFLLNAPLTHQIRQIQLALERLRWLPAQPNGPHLMVNIPSFQLYGFNNGGHHDKPDIVMDVIVGEAIDKHNTPVFHADMSYIVFRPHWNVPYSITTKEMVPILQRNPDYLAKNNLEIVSRFSSDAPVFLPTSENLDAQRLGAREVHVSQSQQRLSTQHTGQGAVPEKTTGF